MILIKIFKALGDETRLRIVRILKDGSFTVNEIIFIISGRQSNISHHLKILLDAEVVESKKEGSWIYYRLSAVFRSSVKDWIFTFLNNDISGVSDSIGDDRRVDVIYQKRKSIAMEYFSSIDDDDEKKLFSFMNSIFSSADIGSILSGKFDTIADIGCGNGRNLPVLAQYADCVIGVDSSARMLQFAEHICIENGLTYKLEVADITELPFMNNEIGGVLINMVLHHLAVPLVALKEVTRVLQPNGKLFLVEFLHHHNEGLRDTHADLWLGFTEDEISGWVKESGLDVLKTEIKEHQGYRILILIGQKPV